MLRPRRPKRRYKRMKITEIIFDASLDPPVAGVQGEISLNQSSYSENENTATSFTILRAVNLNQRVQVDWAITNANVTPSSGSVIFENGDDQKTVAVTTGEVGPTEIGTLSITGVIALTDITNVPAVVAPFSSPYTILDRTVSIDNISDITFSSIGQTHDMDQYINDPASRITDSQILNGNPAIASYSHSTRLLTAVSLGTISNVQLEVTFT